MQNKQKNASEWGKNGVCMIKCCITKASQQPWSNSVTSSSAHCNPTVEFQGTMLVCMHACCTKSPTIMTNEVDTTAFYS